MSYPPCIAAPDKSGREGFGIRVQFVPLINGRKREGAVFNAQFGGDQPTTTDLPSPSILSQRTKLRQLSLRFGDKANFQMLFQLVIHNLLGLQIKPWLGAYVQGQ